MKKGLSSTIRDFEEDTEKKVQSVHFERFLKGDEIEVILVVNSI